MTPKSDISSEVTAQAEALLRKAGIVGAFSLTPLPGGRNNLVYRLETGDRFFLFKKYFHSPQDSRDRLRNEYLLLEYLHDGGSCYAARPVSADYENHASLMEFIDGSRIEEIEGRHVFHAIRFFQDLNRGKSGELAWNLPNASEACFSIEEHCATTARRVDRLGEIRLEAEPEAHAFVCDELVPLWQAVLAQIRRAGEQPGRVLSAAERCISPSDFGFHNALQQADGSVRFVDFEYAGWDDPAKLIADFANQPDMTLDRKLSAPFAEAVIEFHGNDRSLRDRARLLEPLYQVKWACICLNDFLPSGRSRREFTGGEPVRLDRARKMLSRAEEALAAGAFR